MNLVAAVMMVALVPAPAAPEYVALGDSYAAGVGARDDCGRSSNAYPELYASARGMSLVFAACGGATVPDVMAQADQVKEKTSLVTITVGGNDAGFGDVITTCVLGDDETCERRVAEAEEFIRGTLPLRLEKLYRKVDKRTSARVVVLGYPHLFAPRARCTLSTTKRAALNRAADVLDGVLADKAKGAGFVFADVRDEFKGHGVCSPEPWINDLTLPVDDSYHPNAEGQRRGYLPALTEAAE
ncbi:lysophospholipase L1-like esterase [Saccharothrix tamanrassetensis]|uniref:Lysophospholipase L1-like esterase n=1 Tax=Saccharothrix tamanrassetensis TaxID=1051531 RepID=A0A841CMM1_9PSEU|nr:SGNH/GDSL hydrolase family protein [Saccharothrix tamanrassetensis]MBB5958370.1 lysophospholipase L1-like esterase [Saccharothrix tamanrassetensis]